MNEYEVMKNRWIAFATEADQAARDAKKAGDEAVAAHDLEGAIEAYTRWRVVVERVVPELERQQGRALTFNPAPWAFRELRK